MRKKPYDVSINQERKKAYLSRQPFLLQQMMRRDNQFSEIEHRTKTSSGDNIILEDIGINVGFEFLTQLGVHARSGGHVIALELELGVPGQLPQFIQMAGKDHGKECADTRTEGMGSEVQCTAFVLLDPCFDAF